MTNPAHIIETALLLLVAYLLGCVIGYAVRRVLHAARGTHQSVVVEAVAPLPADVPLEPRRPRSPAARLAASVEDVPLPVATPLRSPVPVPAKKPEPAPEQDGKPVQLPAARKPVARRSSRPRGAEPKPMTLSAPRSGTADNLKQIKGIGPKIEASLYAMGIYHLDQIASWNQANVDWVDAQLAFKGRIRRERWVEQAYELTKTRASA